MALTPEQIRDRMAGQPFVPLQNADVDIRVAHALEYIAFYLSQIVPALRRANDPR